MSRIIILITCVQLICVWCQDNSVCQLPDGTNRKCTQLHECASSMAEYFQRNTMPRLCDYDNNVFSVCCPIMKRVEKCKLYAEYVFETNILPAYGRGSTSRVLKKNKCGRVGAPLIVGGEAAGPREYPHSALLGYRPDNTILWRCGGSLVSSRYVLTAGHCLENSVLGSVLKARLGDLDINSTTDDARPMDYDIEKRILHPDYRNTHYDDIALLKLSSKIKLSPYVRPICLPTADIEPNEYIATGWGISTIHGVASTTLLKVKLHSFSLAQCQHNYSTVDVRRLPFGIQRSQLCAGHRNEIKDTCDGDSGGPLQVFHPEVTCSCLIYGITSFGMSCGDVINYPSIYTRVFHYVDWIENTIWAPGEDI